jgi:hypothetical protein
MRYRCRTCHMQSMSALSCGIFLPDIAWGCGWQQGECSICLRPSADQRPTYLHNPRFAPLPLLLFPCVRLSAGQLVQV